MLSVESKAIFVHVSQKSFNKVGRTSDICEFDILHLHVKFNELLMHVCLTFCSYM